MNGLTLSNLDAGVVEAAADPFPQSLGSGIQIHLEWMQGRFLHFCVKSDGVTLRTQDVAVQIPTQELIALVERAAKRASTFE